MKTEYMVKNVIGTLEIDLFKAVNSSDYDSDNLITIINNVLEYQNVGRHQISISRFKFFPLIGKTRIEYLIRIDEDTYELRVDIDRLHKTSKFDEVKVTYTARYDETVNEYNETFW
jgi:hypothetical protein